MEIKGIVLICRVNLPHAPSFFMCPRTVRIPWFGLLSKLEDSSKTEGTLAPNYNEMGSIVNILKTQNS